MVGRTTGKKMRALAQCNTIKGVFIQYGQFLQTELIGTENRA